LVLAGQQKWLLQVVAIFDSVATKIAARDDHFHDLNHFFDALLVLTHHD
jgi:hypothetical protein